MDVMLIVIGAITFGVPATVAVLVSVASRREDAAKSLCDPPRTALEAAARRIVAFHGPVVQPAGAHLTGEHERIWDYDDILAPSGNERSWPLLASR